MTRHPRPGIRINLWLQVLEHILVRHVRVNDEWLQQIRSAAQEGSLVFVLRNRNLIDFLCLRSICRKYELPLPGFVFGISPAVFLPGWKILFSWFSRKSQSAKRDRIRHTLENGGSGIIFMRRPALRGALGNRPARVNGIRLLVEAVQRTTKTTAIVPTVFLWGEAPMNRTGNNLSFLFGTSEYPRLFHSIWLLIHRRSVHELISAPAIDLSRLNTVYAGDSDRIHGILRAKILRRIESIRRRRLGSFTKPSSRVKAEVARSNRLHSELALIAAEEHLSSSEVRKKIRRTIDKLATDFKPHILYMFSLIMIFIWSRLYRGLEIATEDMDRVREAVGKGPLLLLPSHRSHIDYLAISETMNSANIMLPHIAAGDNLSFWPMGFFFRSAGAFFIRRKFVDDKFYRAIVNAYIRRLIHENYTIEVFIEGGRSRTGKMVRPKLGMLEMALNAAACTPGKNPGILPMFIGYDRVIEEESFIREAMGRNKTRETFFSLLKSIRVLFRDYGKLYVRSGRYFTIGTILKELELHPEDLAIPSSRRAVATKIALRTLRDINEHSVITISGVVATTLVTHSTGTIHRSTLTERAIHFARLLHASAFFLSDSVKDLLKDETTATDRIRKTVNQFLREKRIQQITRSGDPEYRIRRSARFGLDYYKNNLIHYMAPAALIGVRLLDMTEQGPIYRKHLLDSLTTIAPLYHWEFLLPQSDNEGPEKLAETTEHALQQLTRGGLVSLSEDGEISVVNRTDVHWVTEVLRTVHEAYHCALTVTRQRLLELPNLNVTVAFRKEYRRRLSTGQYRMSEGQNRILMQSAFTALKDLKLNRPPANLSPFSEGQQGDQLIRYLESALGYSSRP